MVADLKRLFPVLRPVGSVLEAAFRNSALPVLAIGPLLNVGAIETRGREFCLFRDGMTPSVRRTIRAVHQEMTNKAPPGHLRGQRHRPPQICRPRTLSLFLLAERAPLP